MDKQFGSQPRSFNASDALGVSRDALLAAWSAFLSHVVMLWRPDLSEGARASFALVSFLTLKCVWKYCTDTRRESPV